MRQDVIKMARFGSILRRLLAHPLTRGWNVDDPRTTDLRRQIVKGKPFLRHIYEQWYRTLAADVPTGGGRALELGSGAGFFREFLPDVITSEIFACPGIDLVLDGTKLPLGDASLRAIVMTDVFHHIPDVAAFLREAGRTVRAGGVVAMIEPWVSAWSKLVYTRLHHEPFDPRAAAWTFPAAGPLSGANGALPWIVFQRDRERFEQEFAQWKIETVAPMMPLRYLVSGGVSMRPLMPGWTTPAWRGIEGAIAPLKRQTAMFAHVVLRRIEWKN
jgi:SAM-dependent methyltransferase